MTINYSTVSQERIVKLESQLESYKEELQRLEKELDAFNKESDEEKDTPQVRDIGMKMWTWYILDNSISFPRPEVSKLRVFRGHL